MTVPFERTCIILERKFHGQQCFMRSRLLAFIARLLSRSVPIEKGSGKFGSEHEETKIPAIFGGPSLKDKYMFEHWHLNRGQGRPAGSWQQSKPSENVEVIDLESLEISLPMSREEICARYRAGHVAELADDLDDPSGESKSSQARHARSGVQTALNAQAARRLKTIITPSAIAGVLLCIAAAVVIIKKGWPHP